MIAFWATDHATAAIKGFIALEGIYDIPQLAKTWPSYENWFLKSEFGPKSEWLNASPSQLKFKNKSPWLLVHSEKDELVDIQQTLDFESHLKKENIKSQLLRLKALSHFAVVESLSNEKSDLVISALKFIHLNE